MPSQSQPLPSKGSPDELRLILKSENPKWTKKQIELAVKNYLQLVIDLREAAYEVLAIEERLDMPAKLKENPLKRGRTSTKHGHRGQMAKKEVTGKKAGTAASKVLRGRSNSKAKTAAGSALAQRPGKTGAGRNKVTGKGAGSAASKVIKTKNTKPVKTAAGSALTQRPDNKRGKGKK